MKVCINTLVTPSQKIGVGVYIDNLIKYFKKGSGSHEYCWFVSKKEPDIFQLDAPEYSRRSFKVTAQPSWKLIFWQPVFFFQLIFLKADIYHIPNTFPLLFTPRPTIISILDLQEFYTSKYGTIRGLYRKIFNFIAVRVADKIITISHHSKRDIVKLLHVPEEKVAVTYLAIGPEFRPMDKKACHAEINNRYGLSDCEYIVSVGELHPGKNYTRLIRAFSKLKKNKKFPYKLLIAGKKGWNYEEIFNTVNALHLEKEVIFTGYVAAEELPIIYNGATLSVYPSLYEGFGLPPLEAMACGTPLISSNSSSLPEVVGNGGIMVDPYDVDAMAEKIDQVLSDKKKQVELIHKGFQQTKKFSWEKTARETLKIYEEIYHKKRDKASWL